MAGTRARSFRKPVGRYSQARRLVELYDRLHRGGILHAGRIADEFGVSRRTIERDLAVLREVLGPRLVRRDLPEPGWRLVGRPRPWAATRWQVLAVAVGARLAGFLSGTRFHTHVAPLLDRLRAELPGTVGLRTKLLEKKIHVVETGHKLYRDHRGLQDRLEVMIDGLLLDRPVDLTYLSAARHRKGLPPRSMRIHPLSLVIHRGSVYFIVDLIGAGPRRRGPRRLLALDRIHEAVLDREAAPLETPADLDAKVFLSSAFALWTGDGDHRVAIEFSPSYATFIRERHWHHSQHLVDLPDGGVRVEMHLGHLKEVAEWVVGMGENARVLEPPELVREVRRRHEKALARYG